MLDGAKMISEIFNVYKSDSWSKRFKHVKAAAPANLLVVKYRCNFELNYLCVIP